MPKLTQKIYHFWALINDEHEEEEEGRRWSKVKQVGGEHAWSNGCIFERKK